MESFHVHPDIKKAETLPASFYSSDAVFEKLRKNVFLQSWQWIGDQNNMVPLTGSAHPFILLDGFLAEPMVLLRDQEDQIKCFTNVCTHRGNIIVQNPGKVRGLVCNYHGRQYGLDGQFKRMPEFEQAENFPRPCDHLHEFPIHNLGPFLFAGLNPSFDISKAIGTMNERIGFLPLDQFKLDSNMSKDYIVNCHWALYCDNYLEGFHIPFVHEDLNNALDYGSYKTEIYDHLNLQIGYSDSGEEVFDLPEGHPDYGKNVAAFYYWLFPNMMFNFYPWGLSINIIKPLSKNKTKVSFVTYVYDESKLDQGAGALLDKVEREDEFVVEGVQKGLGSNFYKTGRFSPTREQGVHQFQQLLAESVK
ncbi:MAG: choline monooxygenase [Parvicellaceae bacterium]|jgi:choline monooxygenase